MYPANFKPITMRIIIPRVERTPRKKGLWDIEKRGVRNYFQP